MTRATLLSTLPMPDDWFASVADALPDVEIVRHRPGDDLAEGVLERTTMLHTAAWFPAAATMPALRCVQLDTSGVDHVQRTDLWGTSIPIATIGGIAPVPMAEYAMMALLELSHRIPLIQQLRSDRAWPPPEERLRTLTPRPIAGAHLSIIGYGRIGREISRLAQAFGMTVTGVRRSTTSTTAEQYDSGRLAADVDTTEVVGIDQLHEVLRRTDALVVVVPKTELTAGLLSGPELDLLPHGALVINIARGGIVDEPALLERLRDGRIGGAALDVFDTEPLPADAAWWSEPGVLVTPHVAGLAPQYHAQTLELVIENLRRLLDGRPLLNEVDRVAGY